MFQHTEEQDAHGYGTDKALSRTIHEKIIESSAVTQVMTIKFNNMNAVIGMKCKG